MLKIIPKDQYTAFWKKYNGSPLQSWEWGDVKAAQWDVDRLGLFDDDELVGVVTVFLRSVPFSAVTQLLGFQKVAYIPRGFTVRGTSNLDKGLRALEAYYRSKKVAFILIDPENNIFIDTWNTDFANALSKNGWNGGGVTEEPNQTNVVRIDADDETLMRNMKPKWRRNIKKAMREGVVVKEVAGKEGVDQFYAMISEVERNTSFVARDKMYFQRIWDKLSPNDLVRIFVATVGEEVVAAYMVLLTDKVAYEIYGGSNQKGRDTEASYLLKWEIMRTMRIGGRTHYDHWGVAPKDADSHPLSGISYFKSGFGGEYVQFLEQHVKVFNKIGYWLYRLREK